MTATTPVMSRAAVEISRLWIEANPRGWFLVVDAARSQGRTLLEVIRDRYLQLRDEVARDAFDQRLNIGVVAWTRRIELTRERRASKPRRWNPNKPNRTDTREIIGLNNSPVAPGGKYTP